MNKSFIPYPFFIFIILLFTKSDASTQPLTPLLDQVKIYKRTLWVTPVQEFKERYLRKNFYIQYASEIDLKTIPSSVVLIPFFMNVAPMVWHSGKEYSIPEMDEDLYYALQKIKTVFKTFYTTLSWEGDFVPEKLVKNTPPLPQSPAKIGLLFSGGLDAVCSSIRYADFPQLLITVWGSDVQYNKINLWQQVKKNCEEYALTYNHTHTWVRSNFLSFIEHSYVSHLSPEIPKWWAHTLQGMGYTSLTAPICYAAGLDILLIGSTRTKEWPFPYGTHPVIDNNIRFAGIKIFHDGARFDRIQKIEEIQRVCRQLNIEKPLLRVCWGKDEQGGNCCECEKCLRTIIELVIAHEDPVRYGFHISHQELMRRILHYFETVPGITSGLRWHWGCIQRHLQERDWNTLTLDPAMHELFNWIIHHNFWQHVKDQGQYSNWLPHQLFFQELWEEMNFTYLNRLHPTL